jgi:hypothetical protein
LSPFIFKAFNIIAGGQRGGEKGEAEFERTQGRE